MTDYLFAPYLFCYRRLISTIITFYLINILW